MEVKNLYDKQVGEGQESGWREVVEQSANEWKSQKSSGRRK